MRRFTLFCTAAALWELVRFVILYNHLVLSAAPGLSSPASLAVFWFGAAQIAQAAGFFFFGRMEDRPVGFRNLLALGKLTSILVGLVYLVLRLFLLAAGEALAPALLVAAVLTVDAGVFVGIFLGDRLADSRLGSPSMTDLPEFRVTSVREE